jgi:hypothetical protein
VTVFGPDISSYQAGLNLARLTDAAFVIAKTTEGTYYTDSAYPGWRAQAAAIGKPFVWYHFLSGEDATAQAGHTAAKVGDKALPGMLDFEPAGIFSPTLAQAVAYIKAAQAAGLRLVLVYLPRWYWQQLGSPDLSELAALGVQLVSSAYPGGNGSPAQLYPGDKAAGWQPYGGMTPLIYQFTDKATDGGQSLDYNAFRGSIAELVAALDPTAPAPTPTPTSTEDDMSFAIVPIATGLGPDGSGAVTVITPPPANSGAAGWGGVWVSFGSDFGDAHLRVAAFRGGVWTDFHPDFVVPAAGPRAMPFSSPLPTDVEKISVKRLKGSENVAVSCLVEAVKK